jgi:hypothetical protein
MHINQSSSTRARRPAVTAALCLLSLLAACGGDGARETEGGAAAADTSAADTSAMAVAQRVLGPDVRMAIPFRIPHRDARFIAAAIPVVDWVEDPARGGSNAIPRGHEMVIMEVTPESHAIHKAGLMASRAPYLPRLDDTATVPPADSATLARTMGVEDADGDGTPEVWAAELMQGAHLYNWVLRAYDRNNRASYEATGTSQDYRDYCLVPGATTFSENVAQNPAMRQWLARKILELDQAWVTESSGGTEDCARQPAAESGR